MSSPTTTNSVEAGGRVYKRRPGACETCKIRKRKCTSSYSESSMNTLDVVLQFLGDGGRPSCEKCLGPIEPKQY
ncbi:hypothetical protein GCG54_00003912 [Colletotrichum gloeosporioides]|uniref:Uncharacterized protein n=1 Tax=Colletotrichum gloeosporioides TaxID=474922 RepID=A0A8H4C661_COLGL|nr:uncharacterized protein GCG54_00003912 [Colletotrichum gloeosporioides]KAF3798010.1 hypothetical protein GCG54_00003912 [Colletotrichum gloeosporioides]